MAAYEHLTGEQMRSILDEMQSTTGVSIGPGVAHLPTGHTIKTEPFKYLHAPDSRYYMKERLTAEVPLRHRNVRAKLELSRGEWGEREYRQVTAPYHVQLESAPWGLYTGGDAYHKKDNIDIRSKGGKEHVDKVLRDRPAADPHAMDTFGKIQKRRLPNSVRSNIPNTRHHFLLGSTSHIQVHGTLYGPIDNARFYNMYTGEFDDHILN
jgi:hypothetical protein